MSFAILQLLLFATVANTLTAVAASIITTPPASKNTTLYNNVSFECVTTGRYPLYWVVNGTRESARWNPGITTSGSVQQHGKHMSTLYIYATMENNKTEVQCGVRGNKSEPVLLVIQGRLAPPRDVRVNFTSYSILSFEWGDPPGILENTGRETSVILYTVTLTNVNTGEVTERNTSYNGYTFSREDYVHCDTFEIQVAGVNEVGIGYQSERIRAAFFGPNILASPSNTTTSSTTESAIFNCSLSCEETTLVMWFINDSLVTTLPPLNYRRSSNYYDCNSGAQNYTDTLEVFTTPLEGGGVVSVYCGSLILANKVETDSRMDTRVCYSRTAYQTVATGIIHSNQTEREIDLETTQEPTSSLTTHNNTSEATTDSTSRLVNIPGPGLRHETYWLLLGTSVGLGATLLLVILLCIGALLYVLFKRACAMRRQCKLKQDVIYEEPFPTTQGDGCINKNSLDKQDLAADTSQVEAIYDLPKTPSPQPDLEPCPAYHTTCR